MKARKYRGYGKTRRTKAFVIQGERSFIICCHSSPTYAGDESHGWLLNGNDHRLSNSAVILALRYPRLGREPSVADRVRKGGARERAKLSTQGGSGDERTLRRRNPLDGSTEVAITMLKICCHSRAARGNPLYGSLGETTTDCSAPP